MQVSKSILLINSDLAKNRGDRAIAEGNIALIKQQFKDARITGISQFPVRDKAWYGIDFLDMNFQSLSSLQLLRLCLAARRHNIVLWGGGEILKDYTNKSALWYWVIKMTLVSFFNPNLYGAFQGIGPTSATSSKRLIRFVVNRTKVFIVRDKESYDKLVKWGVRTDKLRFASDPAVLPLPSKINPTLKKKLRDDFQIDQEFLDDFVCIGPRDWFHYKPSGILPFKYKERLYSLVGKRLDTASPRHERYIEQLQKVISTLTKKHRVHVLLVPMHMEERDSEMCELLKQNASDPDLVRIIDKDTLSPAELRSVIARAKVMVGFRLHSNIIGVSAGVPSINIYYVDKGRVFFDQIGQGRFAMPIERVLEKDFDKRFVRLFDELVKSRQAVKQSIDSATKRLRESVVTTFQEVFHD